MFWKSDKTYTSSADTLGELLIRTMPVACGSELGVLQHVWNLSLSDEQQQQWLTEFFAFYMFILDRMAFRTWGEKGRQRFTDHLRERVTKGLDDWPRERLRQFAVTCLQRHGEYEGLQELYPATTPNTPVDIRLQGTLIGRFANILFAQIGTSERGVLEMLVGTVGVSTKAFLKEGVSGLKSRHSLKDVY